MLVVHQQRACWTEHLSVCTMGEILPFLSQSPAHLCSINAFPKHAQNPQLGPQCNIKTRDAWLEFQHLGDRGKGIRSLRPVSAK